FILQFDRYMLPRIYSDGGSRVHARSLDMLHDPRNEHRLAVTDRVDLDLFAEHVTVDKHRMLRIDVDGFLHIFQQFLVRVYDFHGASAEHVGWADKHWIA